MAWTKGYSKEKPLEVENVGHNRYIMRKNIKEYEDLEGNVLYSYDEQLVDDTTKMVIEAIDDKEVRREAAILDEYTQKLVEEGIL